MTRLYQCLLFILAATFLFSAYTKAIAPRFFEILLEQQGVVSNPFIGAWFTRAIIAVETALGIGLMLPFYRRTLLRISFGLLLLFSLHLCYLIFLGETENCGCFGEMIKLSPLASLGKNSILLVMNVVLLFQKSKTNKKLWLTWALFPALFALTVLFLPVTRDADAMLGKFPPFEQKMSININRGSYLIGVFNLSCEHCQETARELAVLQKSGIQLPQVVALFLMKETLL